MDLTSDPGIELRYDLLHLLQMSKINPGVNFYQLRKINRKVDRTHLRE